MRIVNRRRRNYSFVFGGLAALFALLFIGVIGGNFGAGAALAVVAFTLVSCLILDNNFVGDMISTIYGWGFVSWPMLIFELSLDGIVWLLTVKLAFWIIGILLAILFGIVGLFLGALFSVFVYPFAIVRSFTVEEEEFNLSNL